MKRYIVTGASRGIGYQVAKQLAKDNHVLALARSTEKLEELAKTTSQLNGKLDYATIDLASTSVEELSSLVSDWPQIDGIINNAGKLLNKPFLEIQQDELQQVYKVNLFSIYTVLQAYHNKLLKSEKAHVVNISSVGGFQGSLKFSGLSAYSSSKAALVCLTECLAEEFKKTSITYNSLAFGAVQTEMLEEAFPGYKAPLSAEQMAEFVADFTVNAHKYLSGKVIPVSLSNP